MFDRLDKYSQWRFVSLLNYIRCCFLKIKIWYEFMWGFGFFKSKSLNKSCFWKCCHIGMYTYNIGWDIDYYNYLLETSIGTSYFVSHFIFHIFIFFQITHYCKENISQVWLKSQSRGGIGDIILVQMQHSVTFSKSRWYWWSFILPLM